MPDLIITLTRLALKIATVVMVGSVSTIAARATETYALDIRQGWNLLGNCTNRTIEVTSATTFGDPDLVNSVWKWNAKDAFWLFYAPSLSSTELQVYAASNGYGVLTLIGNCEGYWVNAKKAFTRNIDYDCCWTPTLVAGWNLVSHWADASPRDFVSDLNMNPQGLIMNSLWNWDGASSRWYFYAPSLDTAGTLDTYIASKGYASFLPQTTLIGKNKGIWVNVDGTSIVSHSYSGRVETVKYSDGTTVVNRASSESVNYSGDNKTKSTILTFPNGTTSILNEPLTSAYFAEVPNAFSDPTYIYNFYDLSLSSPSTAIVAGSAAIDMRGDGRKELVLVAQKMKDESGGLAMDPCKNQVFIFELVNQKFVDSTADLLDGANDLGGCVDHAVVKVDINGDGRLDLFYSANQEDGRSYTVGSYMDAQLVGLVSQPNGKYRIVRFGQYSWYHSVGFGIDTDAVTFVTGNGYGGGFLTDPTNYEFVWQNGAMLKRAARVVPHISPVTFQFLNTSPNNVSTQLIQRGSSFMSVEGYLMDKNGIWSKTNDIAASVKLIGVENYVDWGGASKMLDIFDWNGITVAGIQSGTGGVDASCKIRISPNEPESVIMRMAFDSIRNYTPGKTLHDGNDDFGHTAKLIGYKFADGKIVSSDPIIVDEDMVRFNYGLECFDVNADGYDDIVVKPIPDGGTLANPSNASPNIYINQKDGTFRRFPIEDYATFKADVLVNQMKAEVADFDGDGIFDIVIFPSSPGTRGSLNGAMKFFKGLKPLQ